ncbi:MAG: response regulator [Pseudomonadota bacterium]
MNDRAIPGPPGRVLLIEDEANIATAIAFILQRDGWQVWTHSDGTTALDAVRRHDPDVVVLDVMLPGKSGFDILGAIRGGPQKDLPVLMLTAKGQARDRDRAEALGVDRFMTKPFSNSDLLAAVRALATTPATR